MPQQIASLYAEISADITKFKQGMDQVKGDLQKSETQQKSFLANAKEGWQKLATGVAGVTAAIYTAKKAYDFAKEGASIQLVTQRFDRLALGIGTTGDALKNDLLKATGGLVSDFELLSSTADFLSLGLARNHDEAVRLARVSSELGFDMNQLVLTLTNMTTMRFDALGLQVVGFEDKVKSLEESGLSAADAFKEAFLQQAEDQLTKVGSIAGTTAGTFQEFESNIKNFADRLKTNLVGAFEGTLKAINAQISATERADQRFEELRGGLDKTKLSYKEYNEAILKSAVATGQISDSQYDAIVSGKLYGPYLQDFTDKLGLLTEQEYLEIKAREQSNAMWRAYADYLATAGGETEDLANATEDAKLSAEEAEDAYRKFWDAANQDWGAVLEDFQKGAQFVATGGGGFVAQKDLIDQVGVALAGAGEEATAHFLPKIELATEKGQIAWVKYQQAIEGLNVYDARDQLKDFGFEAGEAWRIANDKTIDWNTQLNQSVGILQAILTALFNIDGTKVDASVDINVTGSGSGLVGSVGGSIADAKAKQLAKAGLATGGRLSGFNLVGEEGMELVIGNTVVPTRLTKQLLALGLIPGKKLLEGGALEGEYIHPVTGHTITPTSTITTTTTTPSTYVPPSAESLAVQQVSELKGSVDTLQIQNASAIDAIASRTAESFGQSSRLISDKLDALITKTIDLDGMIEAQITGYRKAGI